MAHSNSGAPDFAWYFILTFRQKKKNQNGCQNISLILFHSILKLRAPDFALFILTKTSKTKWPPKYKIKHKSLNLQVLKLDAQNFAR